MTISLFLGWPTILSEYLQLGSSLHFHGRECVFSCFVRVTRSLELFIALAAALDLTFTACSSCDGGPLKEGIHLLLLLARRTFHA